MIWLYWKNVDANHLVNTMGKTVFEYNLQSIQISVIMVASGLFAVCMTISEKPEQAGFKNTYRHVIGTFALQHYISTSL